MAVERAANARAANARTAKARAVKASTVKVRTVKARTVPARAVQARTVQVTFTLPADVQAESVALCGDFNDWSAESIKLAHDGDGSWRVTVALQPGHSYRYRYLVDGERWENAWHADRYVPNPYGSDDSVILVQ
jgi:1,4-alpha-glucan branching enzyme